jgi:hypothetical protein
MWSNQREVRENGWGAGPTEESGLRRCVACVEEEEVIVCVVLCNCDSNLTGDRHNDVMLWKKKI